MLSTARCREVLGDECLLSDADLARLRDDLSAMARFAVAALTSREPVIRRARRLIASEPGFEDVLNEVSEDVRMDAIERAAIIEFDGGLPRPQAERTALATVVMLPSPPARCGALS
jgi:hypothetical protein